MKIEVATVVSNEEVYPETHLMWLSSPALARGASAGRFLMLHCGEGLDPLLPRPMSYHRFREAGSETQFAILFDVRGRGTAWLAGRRAGDAISAFGPLGRGFDLAKDSQNVLLVAGGLGVAGVMALADKAIEAGRAVTLLQGARSAGKLFPHDLLPTDVECLSATEDGSAGHHGKVTELLAERLPWADQVFACGPNPMFAAMSDVLRAARSRRRVQALLEERMGCGTGICYGCAVFTRKGVRLVCRDGPRFDLREVFP
jgi:dihydroorotate dehydrogenase electron transfer subunit